MKWKHSEWQAATILSLNIARDCSIPYIITEQLTAKHRGPFKWVFWGLMLYLKGKALRCIPVFHETYVKSCFLCRVTGYTWLERKCRSEQNIPFLALLGLETNNKPVGNRTPFLSAFQNPCKPSPATADQSLHLTSDCSPSIFAFFFTLALHRAWQGGWRQPWAHLELGSGSLSVMQTVWDH